MRIYIVDVSNESPQHSVTLGLRSLWLGVEGNGLRWVRAFKWQSPKYRLQLAQTGRNVIVTDHGSSVPVLVNGQRLTAETPYLWLENQDLRIGERLLLRWEFRPAVAYGSIVGMLIGLVCLLPLTMMFLLAASMQPLVTTTALQPVPVAQVVSPTPAPTAALAATQTAQPLPGAAPTQVRVTPVDAVPGALPELTAAAVAGISVTPTPVPCALAPVRDEGRDTALAIAVDAVCVRPGEFYWRLVEARWLDGPEFDGYHHLLVDVVDEERNRLRGTSFVMAWQDGQCQRFIRDVAEPIDHGEHCPMFAAGPAYSVRVEGLASEVVRNLGLGIIPSETGDAPFLTSYYLLFQRARYPEN